MNSTVSITCVLKVPFVMISSTSHYTLPLTSSLEHKPKAD